MITLSSDSFDAVSRTLTAFRMTEIVLCAGIGKHVEAVMVEAAAIVMAGRARAGELQPPRKLGQDTSRTRCPACSKRVSNLLDGPG